MSENDEESLELEPLLSELQGKSIDCDDKGQVPLVVQHASSEKAGLSTETKHPDPIEEAGSTSEIDQLSVSGGNETNKLFASAEGVSAIETDQPAVNDGTVSLPTESHDFEPSNDGDEVQEGPQDGDTVVEEIEQNSILDLSPLKWQDALLVAAVKSGSSENVRRSIDHATKFSCIQLATVAGHAEILQMLLYHCDREEHNADPFEVDEVTGSRKTLLHLSVEGKHCGCLQVLVQKGRVSRVDSSGESPLYAAVKVSWAEGVRLLLGAGADVQKRYGEEPKKTVLHLAILRKDLDVFTAVVTEVTRLNDCETIVNAKFNDETPLYMAARLQWAEGVRLLLSAGADVKGSCGEKPQKPVLHLAVLNKDLEVCSAIVTHLSRLAGGAKLINAKFNIETPLFMAARLQWAEGVRLLLSAGADVKGSCGEKPLKPALHLAVLNKDLEVCSAIVTHLSRLASGAKIINAEVANETPLFVAVKLQWTEGVRLLLDAGADVKGSMKSKKTLLQEAVNLDNFAVFTAIVTHVSGMDDRQEIIDAKVIANGQTPLHAAVRKRKLEYITALLDAGANVKVLDNDKNNVLHCAAFYGNVEVIEMLFKLKPNEMEELMSEKCQQKVNNETFQGTPLQVAVKEGHAQCVQYLIEKWKSDEFGKVGRNRNLLHLASETKKPAVIDFFIKHLYKNNDKLQPKLHKLLRDTTEDGETPLHYALKRCHPEFVKALIFSGSDLTAKGKSTNVDDHPRTAIDILIHTVPGSLNILTSVMDRSISKSRNAEHVTVNHKVLQPHEDIKKDTGHGFGVLNALRETGDLIGQKKVLGHPLVASYLYEHWRVLRGPYWIFIALFYLYTIALSVFVLVKPSLVTRASASASAKETQLWYHIAIMWSLGAAVIIPMVILTFHEVQCISHLNRWTYRLESLIKFVCFGLTVWTCVPGAPPECSAFAVLLANSELIVITSRIPGRGFYMLMFIEVATKYAKLFLSFFVVLFGFVVSFMVIFRFSDPFDTFPSSVMKTIVMMTNEFEYDNLRNATMSKDLNLSLLSQLSAMAVFILFIILISFVLTNLLVAVAVIKVNKLHRISKQVVFLSNYRRLLLHPPKWWRFRFGVMQFLYKGQQALTRSMRCTTATSETLTEDAQTSPTQRDEAGKVVPSDDDEVRTYLTIQINKRVGSTYKEKLDSELVLKGIEDRERLTKMYKDQKIKVITETEESKEEKDAAKVGK